MWHLSNTVLFVGGVFFATVLALWGYWVADTASPSRRQMRVMLITGMFVSYGAIFTSFTLAFRLQTLDYHGIPVPLLVTIGPLALGYVVARLTRKRRSQSPGEVE